MSSETTMDELDRIAALYAASTEGELTSADLRQTYFTLDTSDEQLIIALYNNAKALLDLARKGLMRLDAGLTTVEPIDLVAFQSEWLIRALQAGDTITLNGKEYTSHDGRVWQRSGSADTGAKDGNNV